MLTLIFSIILVSFLYFIKRKDKRKTFYQIHKKSRVSIFFLGVLLTVLINFLFFVGMKDYLRTDYRLNKTAYISPSNLDSIKLKDGEYKIYLKDKIMYGNSETNEIEIPFDRISFGKTEKLNNELYGFSEYYLPLWDKNYLIFTECFAPKRIFYRLFLNEENCEKYKDCFK